MGKKKTLSTTEHGFGLIALWQLSSARKRENVRRARFILPPSLPLSLCSGHKTRWGIIFSGGHEKKEGGRESGRSGASGG